MQRHPDISVILPAFNEEKTIAQVIEKVYEALKHHNHKFEVIVVDDGSSDNTSKAAQNAGAYVFKHSQNKGQAGALKTAFEFAKGEIIIMMDADGQNDPSEIPKLIEPILKGEADLVIGSRYLGGYSGFNLTRQLLDKIFLLIIQLMTGLKLTDSQSMYRAIRLSTLRKLNIRTNYSMSGELIIKAKKQRLRIKEVPIHVSERKFGVSYTNFMYPIRIITIMFRSMLLS